MKLKIVEDVEKNRLWKINKKLSVYKSMRASYKIELEEYSQGYDWKKLANLKRKIQKLDKMISELEIQL